MPDLPTDRRGRTDPDRDKPTIGAALQQRDAAHRALQRACFRYGATPKGQRGAAREAVVVAQAAYAEADRAVMTIVAAEAELHAGEFLETQLRTHGRPGARWSSDMCEGFARASTLFRDWVGRIIEHARPIARASSTNARSYAARQQRAVAARSAARDETARDETARESGA